MRTRQPTKTRIGVGLLGVLLSTGSGCDQELTDQVAALTGSYAGDVVSVFVAQCIRSTLAIETDSLDEAHDHTHSHDSEPLHDHEH
jgi:hypothetical protein